MEDVSINRLNKRNGDTVTEIDFNIIDDNFTAIKTVIESIDTGIGIAYKTNEW